MYTNKEIWHVTYPIFLGLLAQNVINVTDTAFLGRVGEVALGASAMGGLLYICVYTIAFGFSVGSQILIARRNGEGNYRAVGPVMWQGTAFSFGMAVCLLALMYFSAGPLIRLLITSDSIYEATYEFFVWRIWGFLFAFVNVMFRGLYPYQGTDLECGGHGTGECGVGLRIGFWRIGLAGDGGTGSRLGLCHCRSFFAGVFPAIYLL